jgi:ribosomal protein S18 acetylase RimI-like enzyme
MLELARGLTPTALDAVSELEQRVVAADGGRLKLEWRALRRRSGREVEDLLWWQDDRLVGFVGLYSNAPPAVELAGMVDPEHRREGIATALLDAALPVCHARAMHPVLLIVPRSSSGGRELALRHGSVLDHSEHALVLSEQSGSREPDPRVALRDAVPDDVLLLERVLRAGFGDAPQLRGDDLQHWIVIERDGDAVGVIRVTRDGSTGSVHGFAIEPDWQGQGIGRDVLGRVCRELLEQGAERVTLEVAIDNDHALGLYTSLGFEPVTTEDYYSLPAG